MAGSLRTLLSVGVIGAGLVAASTARAQAIGRMRMPSTVPQYFAVGYGAGHHAPLVRTPAQHPERIRRTTYVPACYGPLGPAGYEPIGCYGGTCYSAPTAPAPAPAPAGAFAPAMQGPIVYQPTARRWVLGYAVR